VASRELMSGSQYRACWAVCQPLEDPSPAALTAPPNPQTPQQLVLVLPCGVHDPRAWRGRHMESSDPPILICWVPPTPGRRRPLRQSTSKAVRGTVN